MRCLSSAFWIFHSQWDVMGFLAKSRNTEGAIGWQQQCMVWKTKTLNSPVIVHVMSPWLWNGWCYRAGHETQDPLGSQSTGTGGSAAALSPTRGKDDMGVSPGERADGTVLRICLYSLVRGFISEKTNNKLRARIVWEIEPKWWVVLNMALTCKVYQEHGITQIDCNFVTFSEA